MTVMDEKNPAEFEKGDVESQLETSRTLDMGISEPVNALQVCEPRGDTH